MTQPVNTMAAMNSNAIERELRGLWLRLAEENQTDVPFINKHAVNLIAVVADSKGAEAVSVAVATLSKRHPGRFIIIILNPNKEALGNREAGDATCTLTVACSAETCYEQITIPNIPGQAYGLPQLVKSLLHQELPVFLWWRYLFNTAEPLFQEFSVIADRIILDSVTLKNPQSGFAKILELLNEQKPQVPVCDINWARLTPWRVALANLYDIAAYRLFLDKVNHVELQYSHQMSRHHLINNSQALLLVGWLASRLGWCLQSGIIEEQPEILYRIDAVHNSGYPISCHFQVFAAASHRDAGIKSIRLTAKGSPPAQFSLALCQDTHHLQTHITLPENSPAEKISCLETGSEIDLVADEIKDCEQDYIYRQTLEYLEGSSSLWKLRDSTIAGS